MPQLLSRAASGSVTVAELLRRCAPPLPDDVEPDATATTTTISVGALLQREGRADPSPDRPFVIGGWTTPARGLLVRRGAIAAGALLAAGTVFGLTAALNATSHQPVANGSYTDEGALESTTDAASGPADPVTDAPTTDPQAVGPDAASPSAVPAVLPAALAGSEIARHAVAPAPRRPAAPVPPTAALAGPTTTAGAPTSAPKHDDASRAPSTTAKHRSDAHAADGDDAGRTSTATTTTATTTPTTTATTTATTTRATTTPPTTTAAATTEPTSSTSAAAPTTSDEDEQEARSTSSADG